MLKKHMLLMILCCLAPVFALGAIFLFNVPVSQVLYFGLILLCPLSHIILMKYMGHNQGHPQHAQSAKPASHSAESLEGQAEVLQGQKSLTG
ncbi:MAG TPA: hypothetical protein VJ436_00615 [Anaerolineales bacterium]|nr:hypothetical protein [Anaerolineales bacterium]